MSVSFERFLLNFSNHHLSELTPQIRIVSNSLALALRRGSRQNATDFLFEEPKREAFIEVPSANFNDNGLCSYSFLHLPENVAKIGAFLLNLC